MDTTLAKDSFGAMAGTTTTQVSRTRVHCLHIGKTGGTAIKAALQDHLDDGRCCITLHNHGFRLRDVPNGEKAIFFLREPVDRFVSAFYSRQRKGQPRYYQEWSAGERRAFLAYDTPEALASDLSASPIARYRARRAMRSIRHIRDGYAYWLGGLRYLDSRWSDILFIGFQESLGADFERLLYLLDLPLDLRLPDDEVIAHRNPGGLRRVLSATAVRNLVRYYHDDVTLSSACRNWRYRLAH
jgi:hypothetical protein